MQVALDGYALRFPRTGIVSYSYAVAKGYRQQLGDRRNLKILGSRNVTDKEIEDFLRKSYSVRSSTITREGSESAAQTLQRSIFEQHAWARFGNSTIDSQLRCLSQRGLVHLSVADHQGQRHNLFRSTPMLFLNS